MAWLVRQMFFLWGGVLLLLALARWLSPGQPDTPYRVIYGDVHEGHCCSAYMVSEDRARTYRVRLGLVDQADYTSNVSPSNRWKFANVYTSMGEDSQAYFIPLANDDPPSRIASPGEQGQYVHWSSYEDQLYFFAYTQPPLMSLYTASPEQLEPRRLSGPIFNRIRAINEQTLPPTDFSPLVPVILGLNLWLIAAAMRAPATSEEEGEGGHFQLIRPNKS